MLYLLLTIAALSCQVIAKICTNVTVPVYINARQGVYTVPTLQTNLDATRFAQNFTSIRGNFSEESLVGYQTVTGLYNISAKYCRPDGGSRPDATVQVLIHGIGFEKSYWDLPFNDYNYSYINVAVDEYGFDTVSIDRFGIGNSSHADPLNVVQAPAEVSAVYEITQMLRNGTFPTVNKEFSKVVHIGHSFGASQMYRFSALHPEATDGIVLCGWSLNDTWLGQTLAEWNVRLARLNQPFRFGNATPAAFLRRGQDGNDTDSIDLVSSFGSGLASIGIDLINDEVWQEVATTEIGNILNNWNGTVEGVPQDLPTGYLTWVDYTANQWAFLYPPYFDLAIGIYAERTKQPVALGELFTLAIGLPPSTPYSGPVQIFTGRQDAIYCGGDCLETGGAYESIPAAARDSFPNASSFEAYIAPDIGHGINFHYNSTGANRVIQEWILSQGLGSS